jgi:hypothetical protein
LEAHDAAHGFRAKRSIVTNALPHARQRVVINIDLKDFFPTISYGRVKGFFVSLGYAEKVAAPLALICTDAERDKIEVDGQTWNVARGDRRLPQGAPTSPAIANLIANRLDRRLVGAARKHGFTYTRYADDMTFSGDAGPRSKDVRQLLWQVRKIAEAEGFAFNDKKTRVMGSGTRQDVTGLVVNARPAVARHERRRFRAWLHSAETAARSKTPPPAWTNAKGVASDALGFASYLAMVDAKHGAPLVARTKAIFHGARAASVPKLSKSKIDFRKASAAGQTPRDTWWTPAEPTAPQLELIKSPNADSRASASQQSGASSPSVPHVRRGASGQQTAAPSPATPAANRNFLYAVLKSLALIPLLLIPGLGHIAVIIGLVMIWRGYRRRGTT